MYVFITDCLIMKGQQLGLLDITVEPILFTDADEKVAHDCFWNIHQYMENCSCSISWTQWEEKTGRSIWEIN